MGYYTTPAARPGYRECVLPLHPRQIAAHEAAEARGMAGYIDPFSGLFVLTERSLSRQGACCGRGCRHCPFDAEEQRRAGRPGA